MIGYCRGGAWAAAARSCIAMFPWAHALSSERSHCNSNHLKLANSNHGWFNIPSRLSRPACCRLILAPNTRCSQQTDMTSPRGSREGLYTYLLVGKVRYPGVWHFQNTGWHPLTRPEIRPTHDDVRELNHRDLRSTVSVVGSGPRDDSIPSGYCTVGTCRCTEQG
jgi:hypothetical protein